VKAASGTARCRATAAGGAIHTPYGGENGEVIQYTAGAAMLAHLRALRALAVLLGDAVAAAVQNIADRVASTRHHARGAVEEEATGAVERCWRDFIEGADARLEAGRHGLTLRAVRRVRVAALEAGSAEERQAVTVRGVAGVVLAAPTAWDADPGSRCSLGVRAGAQRLGSLVGPAACIDAGCSTCANVAFRLRATPFGARVEVVATQPIADGRLLLASYDLAFDGGTCPQCDVAIAGTWVGQCDVPKQASPGAKCWQLKGGRTYEAVRGASSESGAPGGWREVRWLDACGVGGDTASGVGELTYEADDAAGDEGGSEACEGASADVMVARGGLLKRERARSAANKARRLMSSASGASGGAPAMSTEHVPSTASEGVTLAAAGAESAASLPAGELLLQVGDGGGVADGSGVGAASSGVGAASSGDTCRASRDESEPRRERRTVDGVKRLAEDEGTRCVVADAALVAFCQQAQEAALHGMAADAQAWEYRTARGAPISVPLTSATPAELATLYEAVCPTQRAELEYAQWKHAGGVGGWMERAVCAARGLSSSGWAVRWWQEGGGTASGLLMREAAAAAGARLSDSRVVAAARALTQRRGEEARSWMAAAASGGAAALPNAQRARRALLRQEAARARINARTWAASAPPSAPPSPSDPPGSPSQSMDDGTSAVQVWQGGDDGSEGSGSGASWVSSVSYGSGSSQGGMRAESEEDSLHVHSQPHHWLGRQRLTPVHGARYRPDWWMRERPERDGLMVDLIEMRAELWIDPQDLQQQRRPLADAERLAWAGLSPQQVRPHGEAWWGRVHPDHEEGEEWWGADAYEGDADAGDDSAPVMTVPNRRWYAAPDESRSWEWASACSWAWWRPGRWAMARWVALRDWFSVEELESAALPATPATFEAVESPPAPWPDSVTRPGGAGALDDARA